jgi:ABC-type multidrug transport system ATPase subunit
MLQIEQLVVNYDRSKIESVLKGVDLTVKSNEKVVVVGPNGSGKSTLFKAVLGLAPISSGAVRIFGTSAAEERGNTRVSTNMIDVYRLMYLPTRDLVKMFADLKGKNSHRAFDVFRDFELENILGKRLHELSTGQQKMFGNIMAISFDSKLILLDEPFDNVDESRRRRLIEILRNIEAGVVIITHEFNLLGKLGDWGLYFMLEGKLWGRFLSSQLDRLYITRGESKQAISIMDTSLGKFSVTLDSGDVPVKTSSNLAALLQEEM